MEKSKERDSDQERMRSMKVSKAVAAMAIPSVISSLVTVVYNMADTFFVGQTGDALQVAAVSLTNPIFILLMAFANMFGMGGSAVASMAMGEGNSTVYYRPAYGSCRCSHCNYYWKYPGKSVLCMVFLKEIRSAFHPPKRFYIRGKYPSESLHHRFSNGCFFCSNECFYYCSQSDPGKIWKCTSGSYRYCL